MTEDSAWTDERGSVDVVAPEPTVSWNRPEGTDDYAAYQVPVSQLGGIASLMGDDMERRTATIILNTANTTVVIGKRTQVQAGLGFTLPPNIPLTFTSYRELVAAVPYGTADGIQRIVSVIVERNKV